MTSTETEEDYLKVTISKPDGSMVLSYFTLPDHPADPANVFTAIYEAEDKVQLYSKGFTAGDCRLFEIWMKSFETQHERVREQLKSNGS